MTFLKVLFLILLAIPFFLFLLYIVDKLMDELPKRSAINDEERMSKGPEHKKHRNNIRRQKKQ